MMKPKRPELTPEAKRAAKRLKEIWLSIPRDRRPTQEQLGERWGEGGSQSLMSQYLNAVIPLNIRAVFFFAREFGVRPDEIYPELPGLDAFTDLYRDVSGGLEYPDGLAVRDERVANYDDAVQLSAAELDREWAKFTVEQKRSILQLVRLAGVIGVSAAPREKSQKQELGLKAPSIGADLRRARRLRRKRASQE